MNLLVVDRNTKIGGGTTYLRTIVPEIRAAGHNCYLMAGGGDCAGPVRAVFDDWKWHPPVQPLAQLVAGRALRDWQIDIVMTQTVTSAVHVVGACKRAGVPLVMAIHSCGDVLCGEEALDYCSGVVTMNMVTADFVASQYRPIRDRMYVSILPVDPERFAAAAPREGDGFRVVYCARMSHTKGQHAFAAMDACTRLAADIPGLRLVVVGGKGGRLRAARRRAQEINHDLGRTVVQSVGRTADPYTYMVDADVVMGAGYVALEALSTNRRVIGVGFEGIWGVVDREDFAAAVGANFGDTAARVGDATSEALEQTIRGAYERHTKEGQIEWGHQVVSENCDPQRVAEGLLSVYEGAVETRGGWERI